MPRRSLIRIAITGFGPFPGVPFNASGTLVASLAEEAHGIPGLKLATAILPVDWTVAQEDVRHLIDTTQPDAILLFGVSTRASGLVIERRAVNLTTGSPDETGAYPSAGHLRRGGPAELAATLPTGDLARTLSFEGVTAMLSDDAGQYLCNAVLYELLHYCASLPQSPLAGFIHIPVVAKEAVTATPPAPQWQALIRGATLILQFITQFCASKHPAS